MNKDTGKFILIRRPVIISPPSSALKIKPVHPSEMSVDW
jgi:hypothetical protein